MSDISKCSGKGCKLKTMCHRFTAKAGEWQSYLATPPHTDKGKKCEMFWGEGGVSTAIIVSAGSIKKLSSKKILNK